MSQVGEKHALGCRKARRRTKCGGQRLAGVEQACDCTTARLSDAQAGLATEHTTRTGTVPSQGPREDPMTTRWARDCDGYDGLESDQATRPGEAVAGLIFIS